jgi:hypothetical protein
MEPRREEPKAPTPRPGEKPKRFRLIKLEERIAPGGGKTENCSIKHCVPSHGCVSIEQSLALETVVRGWQPGVPAKVSLRWYSQSKGSFLWNRVVKHRRPPRGARGRSRSASASSSWRNASRPARVGTAPSTAAAARSPVLPANITSRVFRDARSMAGPPAGPGGSLFDVRYVLLVIAPHA